MVGLLRTPLLNCVVDLMYPLCCVVLKIKKSWILNPVKYRQTSIRRVLVGNEIDDHSDVVGASPVGAAPTASSFAI